jgi:hypothetical protein
MTDKRKTPRRAGAKPGRGRAEDARSRPGPFAYWPRLLFLLPVALVLWVPSYNRVEPALGGVPFFYWYQLVLILACAALVYIVYRLETRVTGLVPRARGAVDPGATGDVL